MGRRKKRPVAYSSAWSPISRGQPHRAARLFRHVSDEAALGQEVYFELAAAATQRRGVRAAHGQCGRPSEVNCRSGRTSSGTVPAGSAAGGERSGVAVGLSAGAAGGAVAAGAGGAGDPAAGWRGGMRGGIGPEVELTLGCYAWQGRIVSHTESLSDAGRSHFGSRCRLSRLRGKMVGKQ